MVCSKSNDVDGISTGHFVFSHSRIHVSLSLLFSTFIRHALIKNIYLLNKVDDKVPPCFTLLETVKYIKVQWFQSTLIRCLIYESKRYRIIEKGSCFLMRTLNNFP